ncbi:hypothetical protein Tco_0649146 [Tanacetum coccineum]
MLYALEELLEMLELMCQLKRLAVGAVKGSFAQTMKGQINMERREKFLQKESQKAERRRQKELRREIEAIKQKASVEKAAAKKFAKESMELIQDERLDYSKGEHGILVSVLSIAAEFFCFVKPGLVCAAGDGFCLPKSTVFGGRCSMALIEKTDLNPAEVGECAVKSIHGADGGIGGRDGSNSISGGGVGDIMKVENEMNQIGFAFSFFSSKSRG